MSTKSCQAKWHTGSEELLLEEVLEEVELMSAQMVRMEDILFCWRTMQARHKTSVWLMFSSVKSERNTVMNSLVLGWKVLAPLLHL